MGSEETQMWRAVEANGTMHDVELQQRADGLWTYRGDYPSRSPATTVLRTVVDWRATVVEILAPGEPSRAELTRDRDAALAAVDAVRADYAPRREPPTVEEVRAVSRLWGRDHAVRCVMWRSDEHGRWTESWNTGGYTGYTPPTDASFMLFGPDGPVAWSQLARLVAQGGDRG